MSVASGSGRGAVRVQVGHNPDVGLGRRSCPCQPFGNRDASALVAVNAAHDERLALRVGVARLDGGDRASVDGAAEEDSAVDGRVRARCRVDRSCVCGRCQSERGFFSSKICRQKMTVETGTRRNRSLSM